VARGNAPPIPPLPAAVVNKRKAQAWLRLGVRGSTAAYDEVVNVYTRTDGTLPIGYDEKILVAIWKKLVTDAPPYRAPDPATPYPSSVGGMALLKRILAELRTEVLPPRGDVAWENWALFVYGAAMTVQAFPDGNKRACRAAYALIMCSANIPFRAPNATLGSKLADMK